VLISRFVGYESGREMEEQEVAIFPTNVGKFMLFSEFQF